MDFEALLASRTRRLTDLGVHATVALVAGDTRLTAFAVNNGDVEFGSQFKPDVTFTFDSPATAISLLTGVEDPMSAFMDGRFRSDGHLPLAFVLLALFRPGADTTPPP